MARQFHKHELIHSADDDRRDVQAALLIAIKIWNTGSRLILTVRLRRIQDNTLEQFVYLHRRIARLNASYVYQVKAGTVENRALISSTRSDQFAVGNG